MIIIIYLSHIAAWIGDENTVIPHTKGDKWFSLEDLSKCTNAFSQSSEIGEGGYGKVTNFIDTCSHTYLHAAM